MRRSVLLYGGFLITLAIFACVSESKKMKDDKLESGINSEETIYFYNSTVSGIFNFIKEK